MRLHDRQQSTKIFGVSTVRNEVDIISTTVRHQLSLGLDRILILDNGSTDGTVEILQEIAKEDKRVVLTMNNSPFKQAAIVTELAREAYHQGADWVLPFDADEFWYAKDDNFREIVAHSEAGALQVWPVNFVQERNQHRSSPEALLSMTRRVANPVQFGPHCRDLVESRKIGFVEMAYPTKVISRPSEMIKIRRGNHSVVGAKGPYEECNDIVCLHAPLRSRAILESKVERRRRLDQAGIPRNAGAFYVHYWVRTFEEGLLDQEWAANSYKGDYTDVYGEKHKLDFDPRLRDAVHPFVTNIESKRSAVSRMLSIGVGQARKLLKR